MNESDVVFQAGRYATGHALDIVTNMLTTEAARIRSVDGHVSTDSVADWITAVAADIRSAFNASREVDDL